MTAYSPEIGEEGVKRAAQALAQALEIPEDIIAAEQSPASPPVTNGKRKLSSVPSNPRKSPRAAVKAEPDFVAKPEPKVVVKAEPESAPNSSSMTAPCVKPKTRTKPWASVSTGLSLAEEKADPDLAEAIRASLWADRNPGATFESDASSDDEVVCLSDPAGPAPGLKPSNGSSKRSPSPVGGQSIFSLLPRETTPITTLARDEKELGLDEVMKCVQVDDLRRVARARKIPQSLLSTRESIMSALGDMARKQTTLAFVAASRKGKERARTLPPVAGTSEHLIIAQLLPHVGQHVLQLDLELTALVARANLLFSRAPPQSAYAPALLLPPILVQSQKRRYPDYGPPARSVIWTTRDDILTWERAVNWEVLVSESLGDNWAEQRRGGTSGWGVRKAPLSRVDGAKLVRRVWEGVWPVWKEMVSGEAGQAPTTDSEHRNLAGDRFETAHVLTRIVYKGAEALGVLHEYKLECEVLRGLLTQRRWRRGKRGAWYDRLALVLMNHFKATEEEKIAKLEEATQVCIDGLLDDDTHLIYRPALSRRLARLEKKLNLPADECHISFATLLECESRTLEAPRVRQNAGQAQHDPSVAEYGSADMNDSPSESQRSAPQQVGKSAWLGREGEVTVEGWVLEWWEDKGYQGYHAEGSILTTLFSLLMWPVLFHPLPGAFETAYQTAPLDLGEDTFARARRGLIDSHLARMEDTATAIEMLREVDSRERPRGTLAVGLNWDFGARELREITECLGGSALAAICRMLAEEYRHRVSGVPDLIVWNYERLEARFVEVKGPGDSLSETQKVWIDVLLGAGVPVEVCHVKAKDDPNNAKKLDRLKRKMATGKGWGGGGVSGIPKRSAAQAASQAPAIKPIVIDDSGDEDEDEDEGEDDNEGESEDEGANEEAAEGYWECDGPGKRQRS